MSTASECSDDGYDSELFEDAEEGEEEYHESSEELSEEEAEEEEVVAAGPSVPYAVQARLDEKARQQQQRADARDGALPATVRPSPPSKRS